MSLQSYLDSLLNCKQQQLPKRLCQTDAVMVQWKHSPENTDIQQPKQQFCSPHLHAHILQTRLSELDNECVFTYYKMHITKCCASWNCTKLLSCAQSRGLLPFHAFWHGSWECLPLCEKSHRQLSRCSIFFAVFSVAAHTRSRAIRLCSDMQIMK